MEGPRSAPYGRRRRRPGAPRCARAGTGRRVGGGEAGESRRAVRCLVGLRPQPLFARRAAPRRFGLRSLAAFEADMVWGGAGERRGFLVWEGNQVARNFPPKRKKKPPVVSPSTPRHTSFASPFHNNGQRGEKKKGYSI